MSTLLEASIEGPHAEQSHSPEAQALLATIEATRQTLVSDYYTTGTPPPYTSTVAKAQHACDQIMQQAAGLPEEGYIRATLFCTMLSAWGSTVASPNIENLRSILPGYDQQPQLLKETADAADATGLSQALAADITRLSAYLPLTPLLGSVESLRQNPKVRQAVAAKIVESTRHGWATESDYSFGLTTIELNAAANKLAKSYMDSFDTCKTNGALRFVMHLYDSYDISPAIVQRMVGAYNKVTDQPLHHPFLTSARFRVGQPEMHANMMQRAAEDIKQDPTANGIQILNALGPTANAPWTHKLIQDILQDEGARLYFGQSLTRLLPLMHNAEELITTHRIDTRQLDLLPRAFVAPDQWELTTPKATFAGFINRLQWGKATKADASAAKLLSKPTIAFLHTIPQQVTTMLEGLSKSIEGLGTVAAEDRQALLTSQANGNALPPMQRTAEALLARYISQRCNGDADQLNSLVKDPQFLADATDCVNDIAARYLEAYAVHISQYDRAYDYFDDFAAGRQEVYLGRDGIYARVGRQAQRGARIAAGEGVRAPQTNYLIYNRTFMRNLADPTKEEYLAQQGIRAKPVFFDTGYEGNIPLDILRLRQADNTQIDGSIRMLSAQNPKWRVPGGYDTTAGNTPTGKIESDKKAMSDVLGLGRTATGRLAPIALHTPPREQLQFAVTRRAITRHYLLQEQGRLQASIQSTQARQTR